MPSYPNPYGPANSIGAGLQNITNALFKASDYELGNRRIARQSEEQAAERAAHAEQRKAEMRKIDSETVAQNLFNSARSPEALAQYGANAARIPLDVYNNATDYLAGNTEGPLAARGYSQQEMGAAQIGNLLSQHFAADKSPNPEQFAKAAGINRANNYRDMMMNGLISADAFGDAQAAYEGKASHAMACQTAFSSATR